MELETCTTDRDAGDEIDYATHPTVEIVDYAKSVNGETNAWPAAIANYTRGSGAKGLAVRECECGQHIWAFPWDDSTASWVSYLRSPLRAYIDEKGMAPKEPTPSPHVIIASPEDVDLLKLRRWRVFPTKKGHRAKWCLQSGRRGLPLQRMIYPAAEAITFDNCNGLDVRRENMRRTTIRKLLRERDARRRRERAAEKKAA